MTLRKIRPLLNPLIPLIRDVKKLHILFLYNVTTPLFWLKVTSKDRTIIWDRDLYTCDKSFVLTKREESLLDKKNVQKVI